MINKQTNEQGKIELPSQWTMDGWDEQFLINGINKWHPAIEEWLAAYWTLSTESTRTSWRIMSPMSTQTLSRATPSPLSKWATGLMWQNCHGILFSALWMVLCRFNAAAEGRNSKLVGNSVMKKVSLNLFLHQGWSPQLVGALTGAATGWTSSASSKRTRPTLCPLSRRSRWDFLI